MTAWTNLLMETYKEMNEKEPTTKLSDAMKEAKLTYKKPGDDDE